MNEKLINQLVEIIKDYRMEELDIPLDEKHVRNWLVQFDDDCRETILKETVHILQNWFFNYNEIDSFIEQVLSYLCKQFSFTEMELIHKVVFLDTQNKRKSQTRIIQRLNNTIYNRCGEKITTGGKSSEGLYVYLDDGLYTGSKARKEISLILSSLSAEDTLYVFYLIAGTKGLRYAQRELQIEAEKRSVRFKMFRVHPLPNDRRPCYSDESGKLVTDYYPVHLCLWPDRSIQEVPSVKKYIEYSIDSKTNKEKELFRYGYWKDDPGIFTSVDSRNIVEREFLVKGIEIASYSKDNGLYPLGFNKWPSLGFGSFCSTCMNISNTCPLVLWWGNVEKKGDVLDNWYPLLPRRISDVIYTESFEDTEDKIDNYSAKDERNGVCPECGRVYGIVGERVTQFCVDCEWKH